MDHIIDHIYSLYNKNKKDEDIYAINIRENLEMMSMMREDPKNCFHYGHMNECYSLILFCNGLSDVSFQYLLTRICNKIQPFLGQKFYPRKSFMVGMYCDLKLYNYINKIKALMQILIRLVEQMDQCINIINKQYLVLKWNVSSKTNFPNVDILQFKKKEYIQQSFDKQKEFLEKIRNTFYCKKIHDLNIYFDQTEYYHTFLYDNIHKYIMDYSGYDMYFILGLKCSNIMKLLSEHDELNKYYDIDITGLLRSINNREEWITIIEDDNVQILQHYYLPHPDHFIGLDPKIKQDNIIFRSSFPFLYMQKYVPIQKIII